MPEPELSEAHAIVYISDSTFGIPGRILTLQGSSGWILTKRSVHFPNHPIDPNEAMELSRKCQALRLAYNCAKAGKIPYPESSEESS